MITKSVGMKRKVKLITEGVFGMKQKSNGKNRERAFPMYKICVYNKVVNVLH